MNTTVWLNRRHAVPWELPALQRAIEGERERDMRVLAGVLTAELESLHPGRFTPMSFGRTIDTLPSVP